MGGPHGEEHWRVLLLQPVVDHITKVFAVALLESEQKHVTGQTEVRQRCLSEVPRLMMRESHSTPVSKCIYTRLAWPARNGGLEKTFIHWAQADAQVQAFCKISENRHTFARLRYVKDDGLPAFYSPDFLVRTEGAIYLAETKAQQQTIHPNVQRKLKAAVAWCDRINGLAPEHRGDRPWHYVLLAQNVVEEWQAKGAHLAELLDYARLRPLAEASLQQLVRKVDIAGITKTLDMGAMVLLSPFGFSPTGEAFNLAMEEVATSVATALQADKLIFLTEVPGIRMDPMQPASEDNPIDTELPLAAAEKLLKALPAANHPTDVAFYLQHCVKACKAGVERSHIIPFSVDGAILLEVYVHDGIGTMVVDEKLESLREATEEDVGGILQLIEPFERDGTLVKRSRTEIERDAGNYTIIEHDGVIFACAALYPYPEAKTAEMAALTVSPDVQGQGDGERVLKRVEQRAKAAGLDSIFVLTTRTMHWFIKRGFVQVDPDWLPEARKRKYNWDRKSQVLVKKL